MKKIPFFIYALSAVFMLTSCGKSISTTPVTSDKTNNTAEIKNESILPGNSVLDSGIDDLENHSGYFDVSMSGYKGELFIGISDGKFYGTIKFYNWGNGIPQPLKNLKVNEDKLYFQRSISTREELVKYGGTDFFIQDFYGIFTVDKKTIKGYYRYTGAQDNWQAIKKQ